MKRIIAEWVEKAEGDFGVMQRELRGRKSPCFDAVCFHAQQCAEKYLKARLAAFRYPGELANRSEAKDAAVCCRRFRAAARLALRL